MAFEMGLALHDVTVERAGRTVLAGVDAELSPGGALLVRGANGSGKTSLLRAVAGLASYQGEVVFSRGGRALDPGFIRAEETHFVGAETGLSHRLTVAENAAFLAGFYGGAMGQGLDALGLGDLQDRKVGNLSSGQRRRAALLRLIAAPRALWLLDEPFAALDEDGIAIAQTLIDGHRARGGLLVMALHDPLTLAGAKTLRVLAP